MGITFPAPAPGPPSLGIGSRATPAPIPLFSPSNGSGVGRDPHPVGDVCFGLGAHRVELEILAVGDVAGTVNGGLLVTAQRTAEGQAKASGLIRFHSDRCHLQQEQRDRGKAESGDHGDSPGEGGPGTPPG